MFGYVKPVVPELLVKEYELYRATYCGICHAMKRRTGSLSRITITYDSVFLALVRMAFIPDENIKTRKARCLPHPVKPRLILTANDAIDYTADAFAILSYHKMLDDISDEGLRKRLAVSLVRPISKLAKKRAGNAPLAEVISSGLGKITALEQEKCPSVDIPATAFGEVLGEVFAYGLSGSDRLVSYRTGYHLGRFIYSIDAIEDYDEDRRSGNYNPYVCLYGGADLTASNRESVRCALLLECRELEAAVNLLPFDKKATLENTVRNIIYLGLKKRMEFLEDKK